MNLYRRSLTWCLLFGATSHAQSPVLESVADEAAQVSSEIEPPQLVGSLDAPYPVEAPLPHSLVTVVVALTVGDNGSVTDCVIHSSGGDVFDKVAIRAIEKATFLPARQYDRFVSARFIYAVELHPSAAPTPTIEVHQNAVAAPTAADDSLALTNRPVLPAQPEAQVIVRGASVGEELRRSAYSVEVVELDLEKRESSELSEVLARSTSLSVQRAGGLGSQARYSLGGLSGDRVRFFVDGVPIEFTGFALGLGSVPLNLVDRVEIYHGVVPVKFGADALGGVVHLVSDQNVRRSSVAASYQYGSFDTHKLTLGAHGFHEGSGLFVRGSGFLDATANDYPVDVEVVDDQGQLTPARLRRFHDGYSARGANVQVGLVDKKWADRLVLQGFTSAFSHELQSNLAMTVPYGEVVYGKTSVGGSLRYVKSWTERTRLDATAGYSRRATNFRDTSNCRYDWYGRCVAELPLEGEISSIPSEAHLVDQSVFARVHFQHHLLKDHSVCVAVSPVVTRRQGKDAALSTDQYDPLRSERRLEGGVLGLEYDLSALNDRLSNVAFGKGYAQWLTAEELLPNGVTDKVANEHLIGGLGDAIRYSPIEPFYLKVSYEYAARLPTADEVFGDSALYSANLALRPERSHNGNLGAYLDEWETTVGSWRGQLTGMARLVDDYIAVVSDGATSQMRNLSRVRVLAVEGAAGWSALRDIAGVDARLGFQDARNLASQGTSALFEGDRLPNMPYLDGGGTAYARSRHLVTAQDFVELAWNVRYVHAFFLGWQSAAADTDKPTIPRQVIQNLSLSYVTTNDHTTLSNSFEVQNLLDERAYDFYGAQRPGRAFYFKMTIDTH